MLLNSLERAYRGMGVIMVRSSSLMIQLRPLHFGHIHPLSPTSHPTGPGYN